jgi:hypothetical protein
MKKWSLVALSITFVFAALSGCSSTPKAEAAPDQPSATAQAPAPADHLSLGASSSGRAR